MPATGCLVCVGFGSMGVVHCPTLSKAEKDKWESPATFHPFLLQNTMTVFGFFVRSVHSWGMDWTNQYSLSSDTKFLPDVENTQPLPELII